jgi:endonuclease/exonuclease/phosphatase family metal-dependent hydrolase
MQEIRLRAITANLGCGGPERAIHLSAADAWAGQIVAADVDLLFLQEVPSAEWLSRFELHGFRVFTAGTEAPSFRCRSAVVARSWLEPTPFDVSNAGYHGSYLAAATIRLPSVGQVACFSVHASPSRLRSDDESRWAGSPPPARSGGGRDAGRLWDADYVLATLADHARHGPVLAAGDLNEARRWDLTHPGETWGSEYFEAVAAADLVDCLHLLWGEEIATRGDYQIDHVLASRSLAVHIIEAKVLDHRLDESQHTPSDHRPVEFVIAVQ